MKYCPKCETEKPLNEFYGKPGKPTGWCKDCSKQRSKDYYAANTEKQKVAHRDWVARNRETVAFHKARSAYGITREQFDTERECRICGSTEKLRWDHCHATNTYRGRLCDGCNKGLGFFQDSPERLMNAARYLKPDIFRETYDIE